MEQLKALLQNELRSAGIEAAVDARPKHIFSIWRKMQVQAIWRSSSSWTFARRAYW